MEVAQNAGVIINELRSVGSGSKSKLWNQINAAVIQTAMGWTNSHLHHFLKNNVFYALPTEGSEDFELETIDESNVQVFEILTKPNEKVIYEYDFGDGWEHEIELLKISDEKLKSPVCLQGENACTPEDCGSQYLLVLSRLLFLISLLSSSKESYVHRT